MTFILFWYFTNFDLGLETYAWNVPANTYGLNILLNYTIVRRTYCYIWIYQFSIGTVLVHVK